MIQTLPVDLQISYQEGRSPLGAVDRLFSDLNRHNVRYCHWKSNLRLEKGMQGRTDLDLIVDHKDERLFNRILAENDVKPILPPPGKDYPGIENYLGYDQLSGNLFHLHIHYKLVLGEQFVKNYHLPLERQFLDPVRWRHGVRIPKPELEIIVLSLRALLKYRDRDALKDILSIRSPGIPADIRQEITWLLEQTSVESITQTLNELDEAVPVNIVKEFLGTFGEASRNGWKYLQLRRLARQALKPHQRYSRLTASLKYFQAVWRQQRLFNFSTERKMTLPDKGLSLAFIGADGAGKSTMSRLISGWLTWKLDVHQYYLGSKQPSWLSSELYLFFRIFRRGHRTISGLLGEQNIFSRMLENIRQALLASHYLSIGFDRYRRYRKGRKNARTGSVVIYDRYPLKAPLDGPVIYQFHAGKKGTILNAFARFEKYLYRKIDCPDYFLVLDISPQAASARKPDHDQAAIEEKIQVLAHLTTAVENNNIRNRVIHINADMQFEEVVFNLKNEIWNVI